jgi:phage baseplate assembly protein W
MDDIPHLRLPLTLTNGAFETVQQDTVDELSCNVLCIMSFEVGSRIEDPEFGITPQEFSSPLDAADIEGAIAAYEPRAVVSISQTFDLDDPTAARLAVEVTMPEEEELAGE